MKILGRSLVLYLSLLKTQQQQKHSPISAKYSGIAKMTKEQNKSLFLSKYLAFLQYVGRRANQNKPTGGWGGGGGDRQGGGGGERFYYSFVSGNSLDSGSSSAVFDLQLL